MTTYDDARDAPARQYANDLVRGDEAYAPTEHARTILTALDADPAAKASLLAWLLPEERLTDVLNRLEVEGRPVWFVQRPGPEFSTGDLVPEGDMGDGEADVARAILAALSETAVPRSET